MNNSSDIKFMRKAFREANKADFNVYPNPFVGAVIVKKGKVVGKGYHSVSGGDHAEIVAIKAAKSNAANSDLYVSLEPCSTVGKTPPCTKKIIEAKIKRVFFGAFDINPLNHNNAKRKLEDLGIKTEFIDFQNENDELNKVFINNIKSSLPYVSLKTAISIDGMIADSKGNSKWITSVDSRKKVHEIRKYCDCILIGGNTFNKDNPQLNTRLLSKTCAPAIIIVTSSGKLVLENELLKKKSVQPIYILTSNEGLKYLEGKIKNKKVKIIKMSLMQDGYISILNILKVLKKIGFCHVLVEGGSKIISAFLKSNFFNELHVFIAPKIFGAKGKSFSGQNSLFYVNHNQYLNLIEYKKYNNDMYLRYKYVHRNN